VCCLQKIFLSNRNNLGFHFNIILKFYSIGKYSSILNWLSVKLHKFCMLGINCANFCIVLFILKFSGRKKRSGHFPPDCRLKCQGKRGVFLALTPCIALFIHTFHPPLLPHPLVCFSPLLTAQPFLSTHSALLCFPIPWRVSSSYSLYNSFCPHIPPSFAPQSPCVFRALFIHTIHPPLLPHPRVFTSPLFNVFPAFPPALLLKQSPGVFLALILYSFYSPHPYSLSSESPFR
jgi:hypothetical protein